MKGKAIIFSAPSGAGKTTIVRHIVKEIPGLEFSISATTRAARADEVHGRDYYFLDESDFMEKVKNGDVLEWEEVYEGVYYGTLKSEVDRIWNKGHNVIFDVDVKGGINLKSKLANEALSIFVKVADVEILKERLIARNTETAESLEKRVNKAMIEMREENNFDKVLINHKLFESLGQAESMVREFLS